MTSSDKTDNANPLLQFGFSNPLILGSGSFTRKLILKEMGIPFHLVVRPIDEKSLGDRSSMEASALVTLLANAKADHLIQGILEEEEGTALPASVDSSWVVLTADQVVVHDGSILEKPETTDEARSFVRSYARLPPSTVGACVLTHLPSGTRVQGVDTARIDFKADVAEGDLVGALLEDGAPVLECAGGLMAEHPLVRQHVAGIDGTEDSVMGLSKALVLRLLKELSEKVNEQ